MQVGASTDRVEIISISSSSSVIALDANQRPVRGLSRSAISPGMEVITLSSQQQVSNTSLSNHTEKSYISTNTLYTPTPTYKVTNWLQNNIDELVRQQIEVGKSNVKTPEECNSFISDRNNVATDDAPAAQNVDESVPFVCNQSSILVRKDYKKPSLLRQHSEIVSNAINHTIVNVNKLCNRTQNRSFSFNGPVSLKSVVDHTTQTVENQKGNCECPDERKTPTKRKKTMDDMPLSPESQKKIELCKYLKLMNTNTMEGKSFVYNRRSTRVKHLALMTKRKELEKQLNVGADSEKKKSSKESESRHSTDSKCSRDGELEKPHKDSGMNTSEERTTEQNNGSHSFSFSPAFMMPDMPKSPVNFDDFIRRVLKEEIANKVKGEARTKSGNRSRQARKGVIKPNGMLQDKKVSRNLRQNVTLIRKRKKQRQELFFNHVNRLRSRRRLRTVVRERILKTEERRKAVMMNLKSKMNAARRTEPVNNCNVKSNKLHGSRTQKKLQKATTREKVAENHVEEEEEEVQEAHAEEKPKDVRFAEKPQDVRVAEKPKKVQVAEELQKVQVTEKQQKVQVTERLQKVQVAEKQQKVQVTERLQKVQVTERLQKVQVTERLQKVQVAEKQQKVQVAEKQQKVQVAEKLQKTQVTEKPQKGQVAEKPQEVQVTEKLKKVLATEKLQEAQAADKLQEVQATEKLQETQMKANQQETRIVAESSETPALKTSLKTQEEARTADGSAQNPNVEIKLSITGMKKQLKLKLEKETLKNLTPEHKKALLESKKFLGASEEPATVPENVKVPDVGSEATTQSYPCGDVEKAIEVVNEVIDLDASKESLEDAEVDELMSKQVNGNLTPEISSSRTIVILKSVTPSDRSLTQSSIISTLSSSSKPTVQSDPEPEPSTSTSTSTAASSPASSSSQLTTSLLKTLTELQGANVEVYENGIESSSSPVNEPEIVNTSEIQPAQCKYVELTSNDVETKTLHQCLTQPKRKHNSLPTKPRQRWEENLDPDTYNKDRKLSRSYQIFISKSNGDITNAYYLDYNLVIVQQLAVSFWYQTPLGNVLGAQDMWISKGSTPRLMLDAGCVQKHSSEMAVSVENSVAYIELWTKEHKSDKRERPVADIFVTVYLRLNWNGPEKKVLQLENINGYANDVRYIVLRNSRNIVVSWNVIDTNTGLSSIIHRYQLSPDFQIVTSINEIQSVRHYVSSLHNIEDCDTLIMGSGDSKITLWNLEYNHVVATIDLIGIHSQPSTLSAKCDRGFLFTIHQFDDGLLQLIAINSFDSTWKKLQTYKSELNSNNLMGVRMENGLVVAFYDVGISCWTAKTGELVYEELYEEGTFLPFENHVVIVLNNRVFVRHILEYIVATEDS